MMWRDQVMEMLLLPLRRIFAKSDGVLDSAVDDKVRMQTLHVYIYELIHIHVH